MDWPVATGQLSLVHGPNGSVAGTIVVQDDQLRSWGPISVSGKLSVKGDLPLTLKLAGGGGGQAKVKITGNYDAALSLMRVVVQVWTPEKLKYQWNDAFVPFWAHTLGVRLDRFNVDTNAKGTIKGAHIFSAPISGSPPTLSSTMDRELQNGAFAMKSKGIRVLGNYNNATTAFSVSSSRINVGYGSFFTAGSLVEVTSDNFFIRNY